MILLLMIVLVLTVLRRGGSTTTGQPTPSIAPTITIAANRSIIDKETAGMPTLMPSPAVRSSNPTNGQQNVPLSSKVLTVTIPGLEVATSADVNIFMEPPSQFSYRVQNGTVRITFLKDLQPGTIYSYSVSVLGSAPYVASFTTTGPTPTPLPGIEPPGFFEDRDDNNRTNFPDIHIANQTPFENNTFAIESVFVETPKEHFAFKVTGKGTVSTDDLRKAVRQWMLEQGIADSQINSLEITYE